MVNAANMGNKDAKFTYKHLLYLEVALWLFLPIGMSNLGISRMSLYIMDLLNILIFIHTVPKFLQQLNQRYTRNILISMLGLIVIGLVGLPSHGESILLYLWGLRNVLRFFVFLINCVIEFDSQDVRKVFRYLELAVYCSVILGVFQYTVLHLSGDFLGGIFGTGSGVNGYLIVLLAVSQTYVVAGFLTNRVSFKHFIILSSSVLLLAVLAELKIMFILFAVEIILGVIVSKPTRRIIFAIIVSIIIGGTLMKLLSVLNSNSYSYFSSWDNFLYYLNNSYTLTGGFSRTDALARINEMFFGGNLKDILFGYGLGQCDFAGVKTLNSTFYQVNGWLNYRYFFHAMTFLEMGLTGLCLYAIFYVNILISAIRHRHYLTQNQFVYSILIVVVIFIIATYNYTLRSDSGYIWMFGIAASIIFMKDTLVSGTTKAKKMEDLTH